MNKVKLSHLEHFCKKKSHLKQPAFSGTQSHNISYLSKSII